jgi:hypothetical protein
MVITNVLHSYLFFESHESWPQLPFLLVTNIMACYCYIYITCLVFKWQVVYIPIFFPMFVLSFLHGTPLLIHRSTYHFHRSLIGLSLAHITLPFYKSPTLWGEALVYQVFSIFLLCGGVDVGVMSFQLWASRPIWNEIWTRNPKNLNLLF